MSKDDHLELGNLYGNLAPETDSPSLNSHRPCVPFHLGVGLCGVSSIHTDMIAGVDILLVLFKRIVEFIGVISLTLPHSRCPGWSSGSCNFPTLISILQVDELRIVSSVTVSSILQTSQSLREGVTLLQDTHRF